MIDEAQKVAVVVHVHYVDVLPEILGALGSFDPFDALFFTVTSPAFAEVRADILEAFPQATVVPVPNHGRDILPFVRLLNDGAFSSFGAVCKIHTKKSGHLALGSAWRAHCLACLLPDHEPARAELRGALNDPLVGMVAPRGFVLGDDQWGTNRPVAARLAARSGVRLDGLPLRFSGGSMFWFKPSALDWLRSLELRDEDFAAESGQLDGTTAHSVERLFGTSCSLAGLRLTEAGPQSPDAPKTILKSSNQRKTLPFMGAFRRLATSVARRGGG